MSISPPPPPPSFTQANVMPPKLSRDEVKGRGALLSDICKGAKLKKVTVVNDRSAPLIDKLKEGIADREGGTNSVGGANSEAVSTPVQQPMSGLFHAGVPKLVLVGDASMGRTLLQATSSRPPAPRPPGCPDNKKNLTHQASPPPAGRRANAPPTQPPQKSAAPTYNRDKPLPPTPASPSPANVRSSSSSSLAPPPPPPYRQQVSNGSSSPVNEPVPELPQRHNSLSKKPLPRAHAPPPPPPSPSTAPPGSRPPPPVRDSLGRGAAPPVPAQITRTSNREAPLPPTYRTHSDATSRGKPPPPPSRSPATAPPPPPTRNGHAHNNNSARCFTDDFESKYSFHPLDDFPPPDEYRHMSKIYPSKVNRLVRGAPPLPPVCR